MAWAFLACGGGARGPAQTVDQPATSGAQLASEDQDVPTYGKPEIQKALIAERAAEARGERLVAELEGKTSVADGDRLRVASADLAVRRRFIEHLEACEAQGRYCPPRLDDPPWPYDLDGDQFAPPPVDSPVRFDLESWRVLSSELHGRACACRTLGCVDSMDVAINRLEKRPMPDVQGDEVASASLTRARECLFRLRGKVPLRSRPVLQRL
jgi:hypothetical protein